MSRSINRFSKRAINPAMARIAGRKYWYMALLQHTGRRSGNSYATPLMALRTADGFVIALPYGTGVDWLRNVQAAGRAELQIRGQKYEVTDPVIVDAATALPQLSATMRNTMRWSRVTSYVQLSVFPRT